MIKKKISKPQGLRYPAALAFLPEIEQKNIALWNYT